ncbi:lactonase family protein [Zongyangia sp. HA2173]|uniref:lactonase family protein n=1 Tax=Zongyangia sp. HA2173 TaxID=3133035 RepID=UPI0031672AEB
MKNDDFFLLIGSYCSKNDPGLFLLSLHDETLSAQIIDTFQGVENPSYLIGNDQKVYAILETECFDGKPGGGVASFYIEKNTIQLKTAMSTGSPGPCHLSIDDRHRFLFASNYLGGSLSMFSLTEDEKLLLCDQKQHCGHGSHPLRQEAPHVHCCVVSPDQTFVMTADLGLDRIFCYKIDAPNRKLIHDPLRDIDFPSGCGIRHLLFSILDSKIIYAVSELSSQVFALRETGGKYQIFQTLSTLPPGVQNSTCAAIRLSPDGRFLYISNRGHDSIAVFRILPSGILQPVEIVPSHGKTPRDLHVSHSFVAVANQDSNKVSFFLRDKHTGALTFQKQEVQIHSPSCIIELTKRRNQT